MKRITALSGKVLIISIILLTGRFAESQVKDIKAPLGAKGQPAADLQVPKPKKQVAKPVLVPDSVGKKKGRADAPQPAKALKPKLTKMGKKVYLEFPEEVRSIEVCDRQGKVVARFEKGRRIDLTQSMNKIGADRIKVYFSPLGKGGKGVPKAVPRRWDRREYAEFQIPSHYLMREYVLANDGHTIEEGEPGNNNINGATVLRSSARNFEGEVGGASDPDDYLKLTTGSGGVGTLVIVEVEAGAVQLSLYEPTKRFLEGYAGKVWIALRPSTTFYFQVSPTGSGTVFYTISVTLKRLEDAYEENDSFSRAKVLASAKGFLGNVMNSSGSYVGLQDWYQINYSEAQNLRLEVNDAGLAAGDRVHVFLYEPDNELLASNEGGPAGASSASRSILEIDLRERYYPVYPDPGFPFPSGPWRILVTSQRVGQPYGIGTPPQCYTQRTGYSLTSSRVP